MRGNINRKYLKRRKNWFERNIGWLIAIFVIAIFIGAGLFVYIYIYG